MINCEERITSVIKLNLNQLSKLFDYSDAGIHVKRSIIVQNTGTAATLNNRNTKVIFKNCAPFTNCVSEINNTQIDNTKDIDVVMSMYNLIEYSDNYSKTSGSIREYYRDEPSVNNNGVISNLAGTSASFKFKQKITNETGADGTKDVEIMVQTK